MQKLVAATLKEVSKIGSYNSYLDKERIIKETKISAGNEVKLGSKDDLGLLGMRVIGSEVYIKSADGKVQVVPVEIYNELMEEGRKYYYERKSLTYYQGKIESIKENTVDIENGIIKLGKEAVRNGGATGIVIESGSGILLKGTNVVTDSKLRINNEEKDVKIEDSNEYSSMVYSYTKRRGGLAGAFGGKKTHTTREEIETPLFTKIFAPVIEFFNSKNIAIGVDIITYAIELNQGSATKDAAISIVPKVKRYSYEVRTKKTGIMFKFSSSGMKIAGTESKSDGKAVVEVVPTIIQVGGLSDDPNDQPKFIGYTKGKFILASSKIKEYTDGKGERELTMEITADEVELESIPDSKFDFAIFDEKGTGFGWSVNSQEVALKAGVYANKHENTKITTEHNNPPEFLGKFLKLNTRSLKDVAAVYNLEEADIHAKIVFHGVAKNKITQTRMNRALEIGAKLGLKLGSIGRAIDAGTRMAKQDYSKPEGLINAAFAGLQTYTEVMNLLSGNGGISGGLWGYGKYKKESSESVTTQEIPTFMKIDNLKIDTEDWKLIGTQIDLYRGYIKTKYLESEAARVERKSKSKSFSWDVDIPISTGAPAGIETGVNSGESDEVYMMNGRIHVHDDLRLEVTGHADMKGITVSAKSLEAFFNDLILESVQDLSKSISSKVSPMSQTKNDSKRETFFINY
jgi:hypothetical protein